MSTSISRAENKEAVAAFRVLEHAAIREALPEMLQNDPFVYAYELRPVGEEVVEVAADRRLLRFRVLPRGKQKGGSRSGHLCVHPAPPRQVAPSRHKILAAQGVLSLWREYFDLRMYCSGVALEALRAGAEVQAEYGFDRAKGSKSRWVARSRARDGHESALLRGAPFQHPAEAAGAANPRRDRESSDLELSLRDTNAKSEQALRFTVSLRSSRGTQRLYLRNDLWVFRVRGPVEQVECRPPRLHVVPVADFFMDLRPSRSLGQVLEATRLCPPGTFRHEGLYEVTPVLELVYGGEQRGKRALEGNFRGEPALIRILRDEGPYLEHLLEEAAPSPPAKGSASSRIPRSE